MSANGNSPDDAPDTPRSPVSVLDEEWVRHQALVEQIAVRVARLDDEAERQREQTFLLTGAAKNQAQAVVDLKAIVDELRRDMQAERDSRDRTERGVAASLEASARAYTALVEVVGQPPDEHGRGGTGLRGAVATLLEDLRQRKSSTSLAALAGGGGGVALAELVRLVLDLLR